MTKTGRTPSNAVAMIGRPFGRLTVVADSGERYRGGQIKWTCRCSCGAQVVIAGASLRRGLTVSCGCYYREFNARARTHGGGRHGARHPLYAVWSMMKARCHDPNQPSYRFYGARGIRVCDRWDTSFEAFAADMGTRPTPQHTLDRIDNDGNYEPRNCRWATAKEQANNRRPRCRDASALLQKGMDAGVTLSEPPFPTLVDDDEGR